MFVDIDQSTSIPNGSIIKAIAEELPEPMVMVLIYWPIKATMFFFFNLATSRQLQRGIRDSAIVKLAVE